MAPTMTSMSQIIIVMMSGLTGAQATTTTVPTNLVGNVGYPAHEEPQNEIFITKNDSAVDACDLCGGLIYANCVRKVEQQALTPATKDAAKLACNSCHCLAFLTNHYDKENPDNKLKWTFSCSTQIQARVYASNRAGCMCKNYLATSNGNIGMGFKKDPQDPNCQNCPTTCEPLAPHSASKFDASKYDWDNHVTETTTAIPPGTTWMPENLKAVPIA